MHGGAVSIALAALARGLRDVVRAPLLLVAVLLAMFLTSAPWALLLGAELQDSLAKQQPVSQGSTEIDPEWWQEFREHADGLAATFTPTILGAAAPLDNLSSLLDGTRRPLILFAPIAAAAVAWAFLWGAILDRYARGRTGAGFWRAGARTFTTFLGISLFAAVVVGILYVTVHPLLFGPVARGLQSMASSEAQAFAGRVVLYAIFGSVLTAVAIVADYARISAVWFSAGSVAALRRSTGFLQQHWRTAVSVYVVLGAGLAIVIVSYAILEQYLGSLVGGWRGVALAQAYLLARLAIRLWFGASQVQVFRALEGSEPR